MDECHIIEVVGGSGRQVDAITVAKSLRIQPPQVAGILGPFWPGSILIVDDESAVSRRLLGR